MPGIIYHLAFAQEILKQQKKLQISVNNFLAGNLIPDLSLDKLSSHYSIGASEKGFLVPNLNKARNDLLKKFDDVKLGMFCHLYLDYNFIENFLINEFIWDRENMQVINPNNNRSWSTSLFFAKPNDGGILYKGYNEINRMMIEHNHINIEYIENLPSILPSTGINIFDTRRKKTWKEELNSYLSEDVQYTGEILNYDRLCNSIKIFAKNFVKYELNETKM